MADADPHAPWHEPAVPVLEEEAAWVHEAAERFEHARGEDILDVGARPVPPADGDQRGRRRRRHGADRHGVADRPERPRVHARHRSAAARDLHALRGGARALRHRRGVRVPGYGRGRHPREPRGPEPDVPRGRPAVGLLHRPQGGAAEAEARDARRVGRGPAPRAVGEPHEHREGRVRPRPRRHREAEPARRLDARPGVGVRARARGARTTSCSTTGTPRSAARRARGRSSPASPSAPAAGGGRKTPPRNAGSTAASSSPGTKSDREKARRRGCADAVRLPGDAGARRAAASW